jgi:hypothetical protein
METYQEQFKSMFIGKEIPTFKIRRFRAKSGSSNAMVILVQTVQDKANDVCLQFQEVNDKNFYEFISWREWMGFHPLNKVMTIKKHNQYIKDHTVINVSGFISSGAEVVLGKVKGNDNAPDYSKYTVNEFLVNHYSIDPASKPLFNAVMGPFNGVRLFIVKTKLASAGRRLLEHIHYDMLRFMTPASGAAVISESEYQPMTEKESTKLPWSPTWYEQQIVANHMETATENPSSGKRKKTNQPTNTTGSETETSMVHHAHTQEATKILSNHPPAEEDTRYESMRQDIDDLRERNMELTQMVGEMKELQHQDQIKITGLQSDLESTNRKVEIGAKDIWKIKTSVNSVETRLAFLSTKEKTTEQFDRIESILMGANQPGPAIRSIKSKLLTGKRKDKVTDLEAVLDTDDELFEDSQEPMDTDNKTTQMQLAITTTTTGDSDQTNSINTNDTKTTQVK